MEETSYRATLLLLIAFVAVCYLLDYFYAPKNAPNEPPVLSHPVPYVGHIIGLLRHGVAYFEATSARSKSPIHTLHVLNSKIYVVTSPDLVNAVSRNSSSIAFNPFIARLAQRLTGADEATMAIVSDNLNGENGHWGLVLQTHDDTIAAMAPGESLEHMNRTMLQQATEHLQALEQDPNGTVINLYAWIKHVLTVCSTRAVYGPTNPFTLEPELEELFWLKYRLGILIVKWTSCLSTFFRASWLLKAGSVVQMPTSVIHSDPTVWGPTAKSFNPRRFLKQDPTGKEPKRTPAAAFRPWGGGSTLCPGRHFASTEIMSLAAMLVLRYDMVPLEGRWVVPPPYQVSMATVVFPPKTDLPVRVSRRREVGEGGWDFVIG